MNEENGRKYERDRKRRRRLVNVSRRVAVKDEREWKMAGYTASRYRPRPEVCGAFAAHFGVIKHGDAL